MARYSVRGSFPGLGPDGICQTFVPPTAPVLLQVLSGAQAAQDLLPSGSVYTLPPNKVIEISIPGGAPGAPVRITFQMTLNADKNFSTPSIFMGHVKPS